MAPSQSAVGNSPSAFGGKAAAKGKSVSFLCLGDCSFAPALSRADACHGATADTPLSASPEAAVLRNFLRSIRKRPAAWSRLLSLAICVNSCSDEGFYSAAPLSLRWTMGANAVRIDGCRHDECLCVVHD